MLKECHITWTSPESEALRRQWQLSALEMNKTLAITEAQEDNQVLVNPNSESLPYMPITKVFAGSGDLGLGDKSYALAKETVESVDQSTPGFVTTYSNKWRDRVLQQDQSVKVQAGHTTLSCQQQYGFCKSSIVDVDRFTRINDHIVKFVKRHRQRHLVGGKNKGPDATIQLPLILAKQMNLELFLHSCCFMKWGQCSWKENSFNCNFI